MMIDKGTDYICDTCGAIKNSTNGLPRDWFDIELWIRGGKRAGRFIFCAKCFDATWHQSEPDRAPHRKTMAENIKSFFVKDSAQDTGAQK